MKANKKQLILLGAAIIIGVGYLAADAILRLGQAVQAEENPAATEEIVQLTNTYRQGLGLNSLSVNPRLTQAAIDRARDILAKQYFNHVSPDGRKFSDWVKDVGYKYFYVGENLAIDFNNSQEVFEAWLKSDGHRQNLERPEYQEIGVASLQGEFNNRPTAVVVQLFGSRVLGATELAAAAAYGVDDYFPASRAWSGERILAAARLCRLWLGWLIIIVTLLVLLVFLQGSAPAKPSSKKFIKKSSTESRSPKIKTIKNKTKIKVKIKTKTEAVKAKKPAKAKSSKPKPPGTRRKR
ncbi:MAG: CAP domain-containing protein [Candidatus Buchananbacteria bacterium]